MGKVVMPKNSAVEEEILAALKIYYDENDWLKNDVFTQRLKLVIGDGQYHSSYTKKVQMTSYYGFTEWEDFSKNTSPRRITERGKRFYIAWLNKNQDVMDEEILQSLETVVFGRNNCGCSDSDSDVEIPPLFIRTLLKVGYLTYSEFAFLLWQMEDCAVNYTDAVQELISRRSQGNIVLDDEAKKYTDAKPIMMLIRWGFLLEDGKISGSTKIVIAPRVLSKYRSRLECLDIYNIDKFPNCKNEEKNEVEENVELIFKTGLETPYERNRIVFGAPGTGKSYLLKEDVKKVADSYGGTVVERVTFHPEYSYSQFVGTYKPTMVDVEPVSYLDADKKEVLAILTEGSLSAQEKYDLLYDRFKEEGLTRLPLLLGLYCDDSFRTKKQDGTDAVGDNSVERNHGRAIRPYVNLAEKTRGKSEIAYEYVPGPFMRMYVSALKSARCLVPQPHILIIEEINRAKVAAVFGDVFQLLDRDEDGVSEYDIQASEDIKKYLAKELGGSPEDYSRIRIPDNMFIWATMNSADQGVFPMDTAFKRRWNFEYLGIDENEEKIASIGKIILEGSDETIEWNRLRKAINAKMSSSEFKINEDKLMGPFFLSKKAIASNENGMIIDKKAFVAAFKSKVIMYLYEDAVKQGKHRFFDGCPDTGKYSAVCDAFDKIGTKIFGATFREDFYDKED